MLEREGGLYYSRMPKVPYFVLTSWLPKPYTEAAMALSSVTVMYPHATIPRARHGRPRHLAPMSATSVQCNRASPCYQPPTNALNPAPTLQFSTSSTSPTNLERPLPSPPASQDVPKFCETAGMLWAGPFGVSLQPTDCFDPTIPK